MFRSTRFSSLVVRPKCRQLRHLEPRVIDSLSRIFSFLYVSHHSLYFCISFSVSFYLSIFLSFFLSYFLILSCFFFFFLNLPFSFVLLSLLSRILFSPRLSSSLLSYPILSSFLSSPVLSSPPSLLVSLLSHFSALLSQSRALVTIQNSLVIPTTYTFCHNL